MLGLVCLGLCLCPLETKGGVKSTYTFTRCDVDHNVKQTNMGYSPSSHHITPNRIRVVSPQMSANYELPYLRLLCAYNGRNTILWLWKERLTEGNPSTWWTLCTPPLFSSLSPFYRTTQSESRSHEHWYLSLYALRIADWNNWTKRLEWTHHPET